MDKLQEIVNKKAKEKLEKDLRDLSQVLHNKYYKLLEGTTVNILISGKPTNIPIPWFFSKDSNGTVYNDIYEKNIQKYIDRESEEFVKKVDSIQDQIDELYNIQQY